MLCAWTASLRSRHGFDCCQVLGLPANPAGGPAATMIVPASQDQRLQPLPESALFAAREYVLRSGVNSSWTSSSTITGLVSGTPIRVWAPAVLNVFEDRAVRVAGYKPSAIRRS